MPSANSLGASAAGKRLPRNVPQMSTTTASTNSRSSAPAANDAYSASASTAKAGRAKAAANTGLFMWAAGAPPAERMGAAIGAKGKRGARLEHAALVFADDDTARIERLFQHRKRAARLRAATH